MVHYHLLCLIPLKLTTQLIQWKHYHKTISWVDLTINFHYSGCSMEIPTKLHCICMPLELGGIRCMLTKYFLFFEVSIKFWIILDVHWQNFHLKFETPWINWPSLNNYWTSFWVELFPHNPFPNNDHWANVNFHHSGFQDLHPLLVEYIVE